MTELYECRFVRNTLFSFKKKKKSSGCAHVESISILWKLEDGRADGWATTKAKWLSFESISRHRLCFFNKALTPPPSLPSLLDLGLNTCCYDDLFTAFGISVLKKLTKCTWAEKWWMLVWRRFGLNFMRIILQQICVIADRIWRWHSCCCVCML